MLGLGIGRRWDGRFGPCSESCWTNQLRAWSALDQRRPRAELEGLLPAEIDSIAPRAQDHVRRARFYRDVCQELERCALAPSRPRARRMLEREIIWSALERHGLVTRTRGGCPIPTGKAEGIS